MSVLRWAEGDQTCGSTDMVGMVGIMTAVDRQLPEPQGLHGEPQPMGLD